MRKVASVVGIGRVGLPLALFLADQGYMVYGIGRDKEKLALLKQGKMPFIEEGAHLLKKYVNSTFSPTHKYNVIKKSHVIILTLGTPIDENMNPVLDQINTAMDNMFPFLKKGQLIILRSTVSPSTTTYVKERIAMETKLTIGKDIFLAFCPERIAEGKSITETKEI
ncbi:MAG: nucleotide sugar dehydrogenase, partial [Patescibacteria group bacterium]|nr:nucleotide sugar dehydrogenase [Patescibacteria group bacterium]